MLQRKDGPARAGYLHRRMGTTRAKPTGHLTVAELFRRWPRAVAAFTERGMACPGCAMAPFDTVADAASSYGVDAGRLLADAAAPADEPQGGSK